MRRRTYLATVAALFSRAVLPPGVLALVGCSGTRWQAGVVGFDGATMGTGYAVRLAAQRDDAQLGQLKHEVDAILSGIDSRMSTYRADSELSRFNHGREAFPHTLSPDTRAVVAEALRVSALTGGAFDPTVGPLVNLWGFGSAGSSNRVPAETKIGTARAAVGYQQLELGESHLRKRESGVYVDLSGIAKGHAVDAVARHLERREIASYLVEVGGELRARGTKPDDSAWRVAIEVPTPGQRRAHRVLALDGAAIATSGNYRNFFEQDGRRFSHSIDPRSGWPVDHGLASVSVIAASTVAADAMSTAIMVLGPEQGYAFARDQGLAAYLMTRSGDGFETRATPAFESFLSV